MYEQAVCAIRRLRVSLIFAREREVCVLRVARVKSHRALACVFGKWYEGFCEGTLRCAAVAGLISSSEREPLSKLRRATRATSGFFEQREQRDPSTRAHAARKHLAKCGVDLEPTSSFGARLSAKNSETAKGAHCSQTPCQLLTLVPHPPESLPKPS